MSDLFTEIRKPAEIIGQSKDEPWVREIYQQINSNYLTHTDWHYSDEENYLDCQKRGLLALNFLINQSHEDLLVVSHANFIALLMGLMLMGQDFPASAFLKLRSFLRLSNTGITRCSYTDSQWKLHHWNDTAHCP